MKKQKIANYLKTGILLLGVSVLLWNCEKEIDFKPIQNEVSHVNPPFEDLEFEDAVKQNEFRDIVEKAKIEEYFENDLSTNSKKLKKGQNSKEFKIVKSSVKKIKKEKYTSYTFLIERDLNYKERGTFENLIVEKRRDTVNAYIIKYVPSERYLKGTEVPFSGKMSFQKVDYNPNFLSKAIECYWVSSFVRTHCGNEEHGYNGYNIPGCYTYQKKYKVVREQVCTLSSGGGTSFDSDNNSYEDYLNNGIGGSYDNDTNTAVNAPCGDARHGCDKDPAGYVKYYVEGLTPNQENWLDGNYSIAKDMQVFLENEQNSYEAQNFVKGAIDFLTLNPQFDFLQYENWFNGESEGQDFLYDANYWNNPSLSFPQQSLPSWNNFFNSYPRNSSGKWMTGANNVFSYVGGDVYKARQDYPNATNNTCALKVSIALNGAGINIPQITTTNGNPGTLKGADGKYYFLNAKSLNKWMRKTFGTGQNYSHYTAAQGGVKGKNFPSLLSGKKGIYSLVSTNPNWASGHADILLGNTTCAAGCHFGDAPIDYIDVWELK